MSDPIRIGVVGAGNRGLTHVRNLRSIRENDYLLADLGDYPHHEYETYAADTPEWALNVADLDPTVTAVFSPSESSRQAAAEAAQQEEPPELFASLEAFLEADAYDAAIVASPPADHLDAALPLLERDVDLLQEKPIAKTLPEHDRFIDAAEASAALVYPGFNLRTAPYYQLLKETLADGEVGQLGMISCQECRGPFADGYIYDVERSGGTILEKNCHDFDLFSWYAEADPVRVAAFGGQQVFTERTDLVDSGSVIVEYDNGVTGTLELCLYAPWDQRTRLYEFRGSRGLLRSPEQPGTIDLFRRDGRERLQDEHDYDTGNEFVHGEADLLQAHRFLRCLRGEAEPPATLADAKKADAIAIAAQRSLENAEMVELDDSYDLV